LKFLSEENDFGRDSTEQLLRALAEKIQIDAGKILWSIRVALSGKAASPGTFELLEVLGKEESLARIKIAIDMLQ
jgi:glutamyl-tRNA synthetase